MPSVATSDLLVATRLRGRPLLLARSAWVVLVVLILVLATLSFPAYFARLQQTCLSQATCSMDGALSAAGMDAVRRLGFSPYGYAVYTVALYGVVAFIWATVGLLIFWRRSDEWIGLVGSFVLVAYHPGVREGITYALPFANPAWDLPVKTVNGLVIGALVLFFFLFPDGRLVPQWMRWPAAVLAIYPAASIYLPANSPLNNDTGNPWLGDLTFLATLAAITFVQIYRYRRVSGAHQRQQVKWALLGMTMSVIGLFCLGIAPVFNPSLVATDNPYEAYINTLYPLVLLPIPVFIGVAILRSRLWDIDVIIRRTLIYGTLTAILAVVYFGCVIGFQALTQVLTGQRSLPPPVIVASTLLIAALFSPLRRRLQRFIDRRFYRSRYDAAKTLTTFGDALRREVDLPALEDHLVSVIEETMRPAQVSLWLRLPTNEEAPK
jgi:hypothetical protein